MDKKVQDILDVYHAGLRDQVVLNDPRAQALPPDSRDRFMLPIGPDSGQLVNTLARSYKAPHILEIGTSYGYSTIWLAEAARAAGGRMTTMELQDYKSAYARSMSTKAGLADHVDFKVGDAVKMIKELPRGIDFVLLDLWKDLYVPCLDAFYTKLNPGAIIVADNIIYPGGDELVRYVRAVRAKPDMTSILVPTGQGLEVSRFK